MGGLWQRKGSKSHNDEADGRIKDKGSGYPRLFVDGRLDVATIRRFLIHETEGWVLRGRDHTRFSSFVCQGHSFTTKMEM